MKKVRANIIFSTVICLWSLLSCWAVKDVDRQLFDAILDKNLNEVKQAIDAGADVNWCYERSIGTSLDLVIGRIRDYLRSYEAFKILKLLIDKGAYINGQGKWDWTPLMTAISPEQPNLITLELLLSYGADPEIESKNDGIALSMLQKHHDRHVMVVRAENLLRFGVDSEKAIMTEKHTGKALELLKSYPVLLQKVKTQPSRALLRECIEKGRFTLVRLLLQRGVDVTEVDYELAKKKYNQTQSMAYEIIGKLLKEQLSTTTKLGLISQRGIVGANVVSYSDEKLELTHNITEHIGSFLPFTCEQ